MLCSTSDATVDGMLIGTKNVSLARQGRCFTSSDCNSTQVSGLWLCVTDFLCLLAQIATVKKVTRAGPWCLKILVHEYVYHPTVALRKCLDIGNDGFARCEGNKGTRMEDLTCSLLPAVCFHFAVL